MEKTKKVTKREYFTQLRAIVEDKPELVEFIDHELELLDRKNSSNSGQTKTQKTNGEIAKMLVEELTKLAKPITITDLMKESETVKNYTYTEKDEVRTLSNQKISAIFKQLVDTKEIVKVTDKKKSYFSVAE